MARLEGSYLDVVPSRGMRPRINSDKFNILVYFVSVIAVGTMLLSSPPAWAGEDRLGLLDSLFTATSAVCVTGLAVVDTAGFSLFGQIVLLLLIQCGGLGIVAFATLYVAIPRRKVSLVNRGIIKEMYMDEVESNPRYIVLNIAAVTLAIETIGFCILLARFRSIGVDGAAFSAAFHAVSAFCNAGFSTFSDSLIGFAGDWVVNLVVMALIVSGGIGFVVMQDIGRVFMRSKRRLSYHSRIVLSITATLIVFGAALYYALEYNSAFSGMGLGDGLLAALFESVTTRTAGFETVPQGSFGYASVILTIFLMLTGGSPGSTAGGVKTTTMFMAFAAAFRGTEEDGSISYRGGALSTTSVTRAFSILAKALLIIGACLFLLLAFEGSRFAFVDLLFEIVSAFGTVGLSRGVTPGLGAWGKLVIIAAMFIGRIGVFAMAVSRPSDRVERFAAYPRENLLLG